MTSQVTSISQFMAILKDMPKNFERQMGRFTEGIATQVSKEAIRNAQRTFGRTQRTNSRGGDLARSRGGLSGSIMLAVVGRWPGVTIGSPTVPYAAIHEFGGVITPKNSRYLTIPMDPYFQGKRAREFNLSVVPLRGKLYLVQRDTGIFAYILRDQVRMPARPYLRPAMETVKNSSETFASAEKLLGGLVQ